MWHLLLAVNGPDLIYGGYGRRKPSVYAQDAIVDERREAEVVKDVGAIAPHVDRPVLSQALVIKPVHLRDLGFRV